MLSIFDMLQGVFFDGSDSGIPIATVSRKAKKKGEEEDEALLEMSVLSNLHRLFNTRWGSVPQLPKYGLPDLTAIKHDSAKDRLRLANEIQEVVNTYEPRLFNVKVEAKDFEMYAMSLPFEIRAELASGQEVVFETRLSSYDPAKIRTINTQD